MTYLPSWKHAQQSGLWFRNNAGVRWARMKQQPCCGGRQDRKQSCNAFHD
jgi:hypothetical protein